MRAFVEKRAGQPSLHAANLTWLAVSIALLLTVHTQSTLGHIKLLDCSNLDHSQSLDYALPDENYITSVVFWFAAMKLFLRLPFSCSLIPFIQLRHLLREPLLDKDGPKCSNFLTHLMTS